MITMSATHSAAAVEGFDTFIRKCTYRPMAKKRSKLMAKKRSIARAGPNEDERLAEIVLRAVKLEGVELERYLEEVTAVEDPDLAVEVCRRLRTFGAPASSFLAAPAGHLFSDATGDYTSGVGVLAGEDPWLGRQVGPFRIEGVLGHGGMGTVYRAARVGDFEQQVALKLTRLDIGSEQVLERFYAERQILAQLEHPLIARLIDGGSTENGLPYVAMELVEGQPIDAYCDQHELSVGERIDLFRQVCAAVHFAHQNLIVHRDLKPSNILVTADGSPRLLDFGIAKLLNPELLRATATTEAGQSPMTPSYASPEQIQMEPLTTASDLYALGVLLFELLTGHHPYPLGGKSYLDMVRLICVVDPPRPSAVVREDGTRRSRRLAKRLEGDLDAIVLKAIRKEPHLRYSSAAEIAEDLRCHREGLPVLARQGSWVYSTGKFLWRNKLVLAAVLAILVFAATSTVLWRRAVHGEEQAIAARAQAELEEARAVREQMRGERVTKFLEDLFRAANPDEAQGENLTVRELLKRGQVRLETELLDEPEVRAELFGTLGSVYRNLGLYDETAVLMGRALDIRREADPTDRPDLAKDISNLASSLYAVGDYAGARTYYRQALAMRQRLGEDEAGTTVTRHNLASTLAHRGENGEAERLHRQNLAIRERLYGPESPQLATTLYSLGTLSAKRRDFVAAEPLLRQALELRTAAHGAGSTRVAQVLDTLGKTVHALGRPAEARDLLERGLAIRLERLDAEHPSIAVSRKNLAAVLLDAGDGETAEELLRQALPVLSATMAADSLAVAEVRLLLGTRLLDRRRFAEAERELRTAHRALEARAAGELTAEAARRLAELDDARGAPLPAAPP